MFFRGQDVRARRRSGDQSERLRSLGWWHSFSLADGEIIVGVRSESELSAVLDRFDLPANLSGKRVLDIGAWDGWFSFELERRGAAVTAVDCWDNPRFHYIHRKLGSSVRYIQADVYELSPHIIGQFDIVLFLGVLYHLKHPLLGLERVCALANNQVLVESFVTDEKLLARQDSIPAMEFYETDELSGQTDNWVGPNVPCLLALCRTAGFVNPVLHAVQNHRAYLTCYRRWPEIRVVNPTPISLEKATESRGGGMNFCSHRDEYVAAWFRTAAELSGRHSVMASVGLFGSIPVYLEKAASDPELWQVIFKLPPGLAPGYHPVGLRLPNGASSNTIEVAVDVQEANGTVVILGACDGRSWESNIVRGGRDGKFCISVWVEGLARNADTKTVTAIVNGKRWAPTYLQPHDGTDKARQLNIEFSLDAYTEYVEICMASGAQMSQPVLVAAKFPDIDSSIDGKN